MVDVSIRRMEGPLSAFVFGQRGGLGRDAFALAFVLAVVVARDFALWLLTSPAVERAEHRSGTGGEEAHVFERSELCAVPPAREEHRGPMRRSRIGSCPGCAFFWLLFFAQAKKSLSTAEWLVKVTRSCAAGVKAFAFPARPTSGTSGLRRPLPQPLSRRERGFQSGLKRLNHRRGPQLGGTYQHRRRHAFLGNRQQPMPPQPITHLAR